MSPSRLFAIVLFACALASPRAQAVFQPEEEQPGVYDQVMDERERQKSEAQYVAIKREEAMAETMRRSALSERARDFVKYLGDQAKAGTTWKNINRWMMNISFIVVVGLLGWYGWKFNQSRDRG
jgi:hypothetical protein